MFFFSSRRRHTRCGRDWSSDVCSSDLDHAEVQDVAQEAFIKAYRALGKFRAESAFYTWMYRIAINTAKNHLVSRGRRPPGSDLDIVDAEIVDHSGRLADSESPEASMARDQLEAAGLEAIDNLP